ncbi:unnamed protein product [Brassica napus]|uniref:(rape) hypothetical protein n=1 Tax=Brassica napus TaxID=3708 RepID=A0A816JNR8_BRANA|nr:unnamed protein product [Brassica napus]
MRKCFSQDATEPATVIIETQVFTPVLTQQVGTEATNETPVSPIAQQSIETQVFTPVLTQHVHAQKNLGLFNSILEAFVLVHDLIPDFFSLQVGTEAINETSVSPIAPQSIETQVFIPIQTHQEDTHDVHNTPSSPISSLISRDIEETQHLQTSSSSPLSTLFENGADVEIAASDDATCRIWYPGNVFVTNLCDGVEMVAVTLFADQKRVTVTADKIRHKPPADDREKKFEMMDNVEAFYSKGWGSGQVRMILGKNKFSVYLNSSMETLEFKASDLRIHREWLDGVWKMADETDTTPLHETTSRQDEANPDQTQQDTKEPMNENISQNISDTQRLLSRARTKILREQNKVLLIDNKETRVQTHFDIGANVEVASEDEDIYVKWYPRILLKTYIRNGVEMLKVEYSTWFRDKEKRTKKLLESVSIDSIRPQSPPGDTKGFELMDKVEAYHNDGWCSGKVHIILTDDIYSVRFNSFTEFIKFNLSDLRIHKEWVDGVWKMEKEQTQSVKPRQDDHAKNLEMMNEEINFNDIIPFQDKKAEGLPKTKLPFNCGLIVVKMLECRSLGLKKMSNINDDTAMDLRSKLCCEIFDQFMDTDFQEGCRR